MRRRVNEVVHRAELTRDQRYTNRTVSQIAELTDRCVEEVVVGLVAHTAPVLVLIDRTLALVAARRPTAFVASRLTDRTTATHQVVPRCTDSASKTRSTSHSAWGTDKTVGSVVAVQPGEEVAALVADRVLGTREHTVRVVTNTLPVHQNEGSRAGETHSCTQTGRAGGDTGPAATSRVVHSRGATSSVGACLGSRTVGVASDTGRTAAVDQAGSTTSWAGSAGSAIENVG